MSDLKTNLQEILQDKNTNLLPENIKKDVTILGVTGTLESALEINPDNTFADATAKEFYDIQAAYDEMEPRVLTNTDKTIDAHMYCIPTKSDGTPLLDTSNLTNMEEMFMYCRNLKTIPKLNISNVTDLRHCWESCSSLVYVPYMPANIKANFGAAFGQDDNLSDESLNNILLMLTDAENAPTTGGAVKTLKFVGLSEEQATTCTTLSNWSACEAAGWTTGY